jgi:Beta-1,3-glucanase
MSTTNDANAKIATPLPDDATYFQILIDPTKLGVKAENVHLTFTANKMSLTAPPIEGITWLTGGGTNYDDWSNPVMQLVDCSTGVTGGANFNDTYDIVLNTLPIDPTSKLYILKFPFLDPNDATTSLAGSGHLTITLDAPAVMQINTGGPGGYSFALPSPAPGGAGSLNRWDFVEFNCATPASNGKSVCFCDTTNVDFFSLGITIKGRDATGDISTFGINLDTLNPVGTLLRNLNVLSSDYTAGYQTNGNTFLRYSAPDLSFTAETTVLDSAISAGYTQYITTPLEFSVSGTAYSATTSADGSTLNFTEPETFSIGTPSTLNVIASTGPLDTGSTSDANIQGAMKFIDAALNRGIFGNTAIWSTPSSYYPSNVAFNEYSNCLHNAFIDSACYGFSYDDVPGNGVLSVPAIGTCTSMTLVLTKEMDIL